jgi:NAD(P)-dependent dehydrogenase (short-subunit alcohol dehydrogenase family)
MELRNRTAFVTGGASGIGFAMAKAFLAQYMNVVIADIEVPALETANTALRAASDRIHCVHCNVADRSSLHNAALAAIETFGPIHVVCNNAGIGGTGGRLDEVSEEGWNWIIGVNLMGVVHGISEFVPHMKKHGEGGHIVNTSSFSGLCGLANMGPYCASKFAIVGLSESLADELVDTDIGVSVLCPAWVRTRISESSRNVPSHMIANLPVQVIQDTQIPRNVEQGLDPEEVAARVLAAIQDNDLYILTHPEMRGVLQKRFARVIAAFDKAERLHWHGGELRRTE